MFRRETKGGEKVNLRERPYLDVEVVEVKVKKYIPKVCRNCPSIEGCTDIEDRRREEFRRKPGTWVNGENLDKIKFPCVCSYRQDGELKYGELDIVFSNGYYYYKLRELKQMKGKCVIEIATSEQHYRLDLIDLMKKFDIHIEKAKIVIFKEVKK